LIRHFVLKCARKAAGWRGCVEDTRNEAARTSRYPWIAEAALKFAVEGVVLAPAGSTDILPPFFMELAREIAQTGPCRRALPTGDGVTISADLRSSYRCKRESQSKRRRRTSGKDWVDFEEAVSSVECPAPHLLPERFHHAVKSVSPI